MELLTIENYTQLQPWVRNYGWREYNSNIITMLMWNKTYPIYFKTFDNFTLVCFMYNNHKHWFMPYSKQAYLKEALDTLLLYSKKYCIKPMIHGVTLEAKKQLEQLYPDNIYFEYHEHAGDYIYDRFQQQSLTGKKMQKRRNHFNAFLKEYKDRYTYKKITKDDFAAILELMQRWREDKDDTHSMDNELAGVHFLLEQYETLNLFGGCIYIDGVLEAFNIASILDDTTVQIHVEKANKNIRGLYVAIVKHLLETLEEEILYINREDDMGLEALRKAKTDMKPLYKERKYLAVFDSIQIVHPSKEDIKAMKELWMQSFDDENLETCDFFFSSIMHYNHAYILKNSHCIMAMAFINPWKLHIEDKIEDVYFLEGVCTHQDYQRCGLMKKLISYIMNEYKDKQLALQAYNWDLYRKFGFKETHYLHSYKLNTIEGSAIVWDKPNPSTMANIYNQYVQDKDGYRIHDLAYYKDFFIPYIKACGMKIKQYHTQGYIVYYKTKEEIIVRYIHYTNENAYHSMLYTLLKEYNKPLLIYSHKGDSSQIALMMYPQRHIENAYINEII